MLLGCIADDLTGATDLALMLVRGGMRTVQVIGVPPMGDELPASDAIVVALKSRTIPADDAVAQSLAAAEVLLAAGARQLFFKYCSTFDSTDAGNIGPVAEALLSRLGGGLTLACPAFPANRRTVYEGQLFVGGVPLAESPMKDHPLTPMRDSNLVRVLQRQTRLPVGLIAYDVVERGAEAVADALESAGASGQGIVIVDALNERHLRDIGTAARHLPLITGGSGVALGLPDNFRRDGLLAAADPTESFSAPAGLSAILAGSCSAATREQVARAKAAGLPSIEVDAADLAGGPARAEAVAARARECLSPRAPVLVYSSAPPEVVRRVQAELGREESGHLVEQAMARIAKALVDSGVTRMIVAGGETSGAVITALGLSALEIGPEIDPGVPWTRSLDGRPLALALKSGNFGAPDFFTKAWDQLQ
jgi:uncharacterized protein YgbK (DUF1537 family)